MTPGTDDWEARGCTVRLRDHFAKVSARYRTLRELDFEAVRIVSDVVARAVDLGKPVRLVDVATGSGRYLDAVNHCLGSALGMQVVSIGLDLSPPMLRQARIRNRHAGLRTRHLVGAVETLPFRASICDVMTCFNAVHHFDLARFAGEASRVLTPSGQLVVYTRTPEQNRRTIWGRHFPEFATRETRLHEVNDVRAALEATGAFRSVARADGCVAGHHLLGSTRRTSHPLSLFDLSAVFRRCAPRGDRHLPPARAGGVSRRDAHHA